MGTLYYVTLFASLGFSHAIFFNATDYNEVYICDVGERTVGVCTDPGRCRTESFVSPDCGIEGTWEVCCPSTSDKRLPPPVGSTSRQKCKDFAEETLETPRCPLFRLFNGTNEAATTEFPHMAALGYKSRFIPGKLLWLCAGSLISELYVLTEHICASGAKGTGRPRRIRLGDIDLNSLAGDEYAQEIPVQKIHRLWKSKEDGIYHNVALIRLERPASLTAAVRPACLHVEPIIPSAGAVVAGWGRTSNEYSGVERQLLRKADLTLIPRHQCSEIYDSSLLEGFINPGMLNRNIFICAGHPQGLKDTCMGDGGVPLMVKLASPYCTYSIIGILAFGSVPCGQPLKPSVFTRIYHYIPWIEKIVWPGETK